jgi:hypothetical protein
LAAVFQERSEALFVVHHLQPVGIYTSMISRL